MKKPVSWVVWAAVAVVVIVAVFLLVGGTRSNEQASNAPGPGGTQAASSTPDAPIVSAPQDTSNAALSEDLSNIDSELGGLQSDVTGVNADLSASTTQGQ